jgi:hypothetical protein
MEGSMTVDQTFAALEADVRAAETALVEVAQSKPGTWWTPHELRQQARNGWSPGAMGLALDSLIARRVFEVNVEKLVRLCE